MFARAAPVLLLVAGAVVAELPPRYAGRRVTMVQPGDPLVTEALRTRGPGWTLATRRSCADTGECGEVTRHDCLARTKEMLSR